MPLPAQVDPGWRPPLDAVESSIITQIRPVSLLAGSNRVEFSLPKYPAHCIDLSSTKLGVEYKICKEDGSNVVTGTKFMATINSPLDTIFSQINISVNAEQIINCSNNHIFSFFSNHLNYSEEYRRSILYTNRYYESTAGNEGNPKSKSTLALAALVKDSKKVKCVGFFPHPFFKTPKYLLPNTELAVTLTQTKSDLFILTDMTEKLKVVLTDVYMLMRLIKIDTAMLNSINESLHKVPYMIPFKNTVIKAYTMPAAETSFKVYNVFNGPLPSRIFCLQILTSAYLGSIASSPLVFAHNELKEFLVSYNGISIPLQKVDFQMGADDGVCLYDYINTMLGLNNSQITPGISYEKYSTDFFFIGVNLVNDCAASNSTLPFTPGTINISLEFNKALAANSTLLVIGEYSQSFVSIDKTGGVKVIER
jgi:hypothetical protein